MMTPILCALCAKIIMDLCRQKLGPLFLVGDTVDGSEIWLTTCHVSNRMNTGISTTSTGEPDF